MNRQGYGGSEAIDQMQQGNRSFPIQMSPSSRGTPRNGPLARPPRHPSPQQDSESEQGGNQARKRINVACSRCRKRKIKCSGDLGTGICTNCKNVGSESCEFLRVNSTPAPLSWPYAHSGLPNASSMVRNNLGQYSSYPASALTTTPFPGPVHPLHSYSTTTYPYAASRQSYPAAYNHGFSDDMFQNYELQQPTPFPSTTSEPHLPSVEYITPDSSRQWTPVAVAGRQSNQSLNLDQESSSRLTQHHYAHPLAVSAAATPNTSGSVMFPGLGSLKNYLPSFASHGSRTLPVPESQRASISHGANRVSSVSGESGIHHTLNFRPGLPWNNEKGPNDEASNSSASSTISGGGTSGNSTSPEATYKSTSLAFQGTEPNQSGRGTYYAPSNTATNTPSTGGQLDPETATFHTRLSQDAEVPNQQQSTRHYGYSLGNSTRNGTNDSMISDGTLMSGQLYTRLEEPQQSYESLPALSGEASHASYRTSVSNLTNARLY